jgi:uncharacterized phage protein (TIGR01671 family)
MREILFKGKTKMQVRTYNCGKKDNEWVYGHYYDKVGLPIIRQFELDRADYVEYEVDRETVGQYTGLKDKNGNRIFEGDIVKFAFRYGPNREKSVNENLIVKWSDEFLSYEFSKSKWDACFISGLKNDFEVIGNIHDNKNLIGE